MKAILTQEQTILVDAAQKIAGDGLTAAQRVVSGQPWPKDPDSTLLQGWSGLGVSEERGGDGGGLIELALLVKTLSTKLAPTRYPTHAMAIQVAQSAGLPLTNALDGSRVWCLAVAEGQSLPFGPFSSNIADGALNASKPGVPCGAMADEAVVVLANDEVTIAKPTSRTETSSADLLAPSASLGFDNVAVEAAAGGARSGLLKATAIAAAELCGVAQGAVELGAQYAENRVQFGRPIGVFQGVAHQLADAMVASETAWSLTLYACWALDNNARDAAKAVHAAKAKASEAAVFAAERALHVHGGMGMTWEAAPHLFLRRALAQGAWLGGAHWHRTQVGSMLIDQHRS